MGLFDVFSKGGKYFGKAIEPKCEYCDHGKRSSDGNKVLCTKKGMVDASFHCPKFLYSPLKRIPVKQMQRVGWLEGEYEDKDFDKLHAERMKQKAEEEKKKAAEEAAQAKAAAPAPAPAPAPAAAPAPAVTAPQTAAAPAAPAAQTAATPATPTYTRPPVMTPPAPTAQAAAAAPAATAAGTARTAPSAAQPTAARQAPGVVPDALASLLKAADQAPAYQPEQPKTEQPGADPSILSNM